MCLAERKTQRSKEKTQVGVASREQQIDGSLIDREALQTRTDARICSKQSEK